MNTDKKRVKNSFIGVYPRSSAAQDGTSDFAPGDGTVARTAHLRQDVFPMQHRAPLIFLAVLLAALLPCCS